MAAEKSWTFMVYMAGDNDLDKEGIKDLREMKQVGSSDQVNVIAQLDRAKGHEAKRYYLSGSSELEDDEQTGFDKVVNMGDPSELTDFIKWGVKNYPAKHYALVLWNHGAGWSDKDYYADVRVRSLGLRGLNKSLRRTLFKSSVDQALEKNSLENLRAILFDDHAKDFLDNKEMKTVLADTASLLDRKLDILGMDACLMSMAEVGYQMRESADFTVGSEETEPFAGWPYDRILAELVKSPEMTPEGLCEVIVDQYLASYEGGDYSVTQSACRLSQAEALAEAVADLTKALTGSLGDAETRRKIRDARDQVQAYEDTDNIDLIDFCATLQDQKAGAVIDQRCQQVIEAVQAYVVKDGYYGDDLEYSYGVAIYFPMGKVSPLYTENLDFSPKTGWDTFLKDYKGAIRSPRLPRP